MCFKDAKYLLFGMHIMKYALRSTSFGTSALSMMLVALASTAQAQTLPDSARPSTMEQQFRMEENRPAVGGAPVISVPDQSAKEIRGGVAFELNAITIEGETVYGEAELKPIYADKLGTKVTLGELNKIASDITTLYRNNGYILTRAVIPPQRAEGGNVTIRIVEGFVNEVKLQGDITPGQESNLQAYADKIRASKPLDAKKLERYLLLMEDLPGVEARAVLQPSATTPGASDVIVSIKRKMIDLAVTADNRGSKYLGPVQGGASVSANNVIGLDEQTRFRFINSTLDDGELAFGEIRHEQQIGTEGTNLILDASRTRTNPGATLEALEIKGVSDALSVGVSHPMIRSRRSNWFLNSDFTYRNVDVNTLGTDLYRDETRVLTAGTTYDFVSSDSAINRMEGSLSKGFGWGTDNIQGHSRVNGEDSFLKANAKMSRIQPVYGPFSVFGALSGQYSFDPLYASEEFAAGGSEFGSAFDAAEITGDSGAAGRLELQYNQGALWDVISQYQLYGFYDQGYVWNRNIQAGSEDVQSVLASTGLGARFNVMESLSGGMELALPVVHKVASRGEDGDNSRFFFNLQYRY